MDDRVRVLHVDDEPGFADLAGEMLEREDGRIDVDTATSADAGLERLEGERGPPDCIVSDYEMPGTDGIDFLNSVRADHPDLPFVLFTGKGSEAVASDAISAGATDYLRKRSSNEQYELLANRILNAVEQDRARKQAERTQRRLREITDSSVDCLWVFTSDWDELLFVSGYEDVWGRSAASLRENPGDFLGTVHPDDRESVEAAMERLSAGRTVDIEYRIRTDEELAWVWVKGEPIYDDGEVVRIVGFARDITDRKHRERALRRERDFVEQALNSLEDVFYVVGADGTVRRWNDRLAEVTGYSASELDGIDAPTLFAEADRDVISRAVEPPIDEQDPTVEAALRTADGDTIPYEFSGARLTDPDGEFAGLVGVGRDLTERHERERELAEANLKLEALSEAFPDLAFVVSVDGQYLEAFAGPETESLLYDGPEPYEAGDQHVRDVFDDEQAERVLETFRRAADTGEIQSIEYELDVDSERRWFEGRVAPVDGAVGGREAVVWVVRDGTERTERERELQRQNARLEEFASVVSHDLRNPLQAAAGRLELAGEECGSDHLDAAADAIGRSRTLVDDLLTLAREGETAGEIEAVDLSAAACERWDGIGPAAARLRIETDRTVRADPDGLAQILENLLRNCVEHGSTGPRSNTRGDAVEQSTDPAPESRVDVVDGPGVTVTVGDLEDGFYVEDDGPGIDPADRATVFDPGYSTSDDGTGFGLRVVKRIAEAHGWSVRAVEGARGGARFEITGVEFAE